MNDAIQGIVAWFVSGFVWWLLGPTLVQGELSELTGFLRWLLEYGWIPWLAFGMVVLVLYGLLNGLLELTKEK